MSELDKDFKKVAKQINDQIKEAAKAMKEANRLAKEAGLSCLAGTSEYEDYETDEEMEQLNTIAGLINIYPLFTEIDKAGWRTSSIGC